MVVAAAVGLVVVVAPGAQASPLACPGIVETSPNQYKLVSDAMCDLSLLADGATVRLAGHTLTTGTPGHPATFVGASGVTLVNGNVRGGPIYWQGDHGRLDRVDASSIDPSAPSGYFAQVAGAGFEVTRSRFHDLTTALDLYYVGDVTISDSVFSRNTTAVAVQKKDRFTIERSTFEENGTGLYLRNEDGLGVNDVVVADNLFRDNTGAGIQANLKRVAPFPNPRALDNVQITGNRLIRNGGPGIDVTLTCETDAGCLVGQSSIVLTGNTIRQNGYAPPAGLGDDGVTARTLVGSSPATTGTQGLSVLTLTGNDARKNADLGFDVQGATDGGGNVARGNGNPAQCVGITCS